MIKMKALSNFKGLEGFVHRGSIFTARDESRAEELEKAGRATREIAPKKKAPANKRQKKTVAPESKEEGAEAPESKEDDSSEGEKAEGDE